MALSFVNKPEAEAQLIGALDPIDPVVLNATTQESHTALRDEGSSPELSLGDDPTAEARRLI